MPPRGAGRRDPPPEHRTPATVGPRLGEPASQADPGEFAADEQSIRDRAALAAALDPIITIDIEGTIQSASDSVQRVFGWSPRELVGRNVNVLMPDPHRSAHDGYLANYRRTGQTNILGRPREFEAVRRSGERFPIELCVSRVETSDGGMPQFVGIIRDISAQKRLEREALLLKDLAFRIAGAPTIAEARVEALRLIGTATSWDHGEVWLATEDGAGDHLVCVASWARPGSGLEAFSQSVAGMRFPKGAGMGGRAWVTKRPCWYGDLSKLSVDDLCRPEAAREAGLRAAAAIPLVADGVVMEVLLFFARTTRSEDMHLLELAHAAAASLAVLIQRKRAEDRLRDSEALVRAELGAMSKLHGLANLLLQRKDIPAAIADVLDAAIELTDANMGNVQLLDPETGVLSIAAHRGFQQGFLEHFRAVTLADASACARALRERERVIIEDVQADPAFAPHRRVAAEAGYRAVQSTPLIASDGALLGVLSTHFAAVHRPSERDLRILDLYARHAADFIERTRAQQRLDDYSHSLEKRVEERTRELMESRDRLRMTDRMASIGTLAAGLGHDMNNVLLPVRARLNALTASGEAGDLQKGDRKHVEEIRKGVAYLQQLADGLHFLALDPDTEEDQRGGGAATDIVQWWSQTGALLSKAVPKHVRVVASLRDLPQIAVPAHGLTQAVLNLVVNAGEAIPPPSERKRTQGLVRIWAEAAEDDTGCWVRLGVTDNGTGMSEDVRRRACEMFFTTKPRGLGTGLGLALVRMVMEHAHGRVEIESEPGKGTTVVMVAPAVSPAADAERTASRPRALISIGDGRAAGLLRHVLESSGAVVEPRDAASAHIWILDPSTTTVQDAKAWRRHRPAGRLVLFGKPDRACAASWTSLDPVTIDAPEDFETVRRAVKTALSQRT